MEKRNRTIIEEANKFVELYENLGYVLKSEATTDFFFQTNVMSEGILREEAPKRSLAEWLSSSINDYIWCRENYNIHKDSKDAFIRLSNSAYRCLMWKTRAISHNLLIESSGLAQKLKECQEQNSNLKERADNLEREIMRLRNENEELHKALDIFAGRGNVTKQ